MANHLDPVYNWEFYIGTALSGETYTYSPFCAGIESITENINSQNKQYFFLCQDGCATNEVTGIAPQYTVSGRRIYGDAAQEYVCGLKYQFGKDRKTSFKMEHIDYSGSTPQKTTIVCGCTILDISDIGGSTTDDVPFSCTIALDGKPTVTTEAVTT